MAEVPFVPQIWQSVRGRLRSSFFRGLRHVAEIDDTRQILSSALLRQGLGPVRREVGFSAPPYRDLGLAGDHGDGTRLRPDIVFVSGRYRSGSTLVWNIFRNLPGTTAYYEPFNERRWFAHDARGDRVDPSHRGVDDYWREYDGLGFLGALFDDRWKFSQLHMGPDAWSPSMVRYMEALIRHASGQPVLQFNEIDFRLGWLRAQFPHCRIVHIYRHPRDQWLSTLGQSSSGLRGMKIGTFAPLDGFYLLSAAQDLRHYFPLLTLDPDANPYELFYQIWRLSILYGRSYADVSLSLEDLVRAPVATIGDMLERLGRSRREAGDLAALVKPIELDRWQRCADAAWFQDIEGRVETQLGEYFRSAPPSG